MYVDYVMEDSFGRRNAQKMLGGFSAGTELSKANYQKKVIGMMQKIMFLKRRSNFLS